MSIFIANQIISSSYWILIVLWMIIIRLYWTRFSKVKNHGVSGAILFLILTLDAFRTLIENAFYGFSFNSIHGFLPTNIQQLLSIPEILILPKIFTIICGCFMIYLLLRHWDPNKIEEINHHKQQKDLARKVYSHTQEGILITDPDGYILDCNQACINISGFAREEILGKTPRIFKSGHQSPEFYENMWDTLISKGYWRDEIWNKRKNGNISAEILTINAIYNTQNEIQQYVAIFSDITQLKTHQAELEHQALYDLITGLPNRQYLSQFLSQEMASCIKNKHSLAVAFLDLDGFKIINDSYGHTLGDQLLMKVAQNMQATLCKGDILARIGGDEFIAIINHFSQKEDALFSLDRLLQAAALPVIVEGKKLAITTSIGATIYPYDNVDADKLIRHADQAMYLAKQAGKNCYQLFDINQDEKQQLKKESFQQIKQGLKQNEFVLFYQPKVNMRTGEILGAEALIRWQHPQKGLLAPGAFLPFIEGHFIHIELGEWVIDTALQQLSQWQKLHLNVAISVNITAIHLQDPSFISRLNKLLNQYPEVDNHLLELEILETSALIDLHKVSEVIQACGVSFALDDFGTGYSSLTYLRQLPVTLIKIDQSFIRNILVNTADKAIVKGVIELAKAFDRQVIAEGVESMEHGALLLQLGCELAQGYAIAKPMPADDFPHWALNWQPDILWQQSQ